MPMCPACQKPADKVIAAGLPMKLCTDDDCHTLFGEPFATIYTYVFAPLEGFFNENFAFFSYEGSYFKALYRWFTDEVEDE